MKQILIIAIALLTTQTTLATSWDIETLMSHAVIEDKLSFLQSKGWKQTDGPLLFTSYQFVYTGSHQMTRKILIIPIQRSSIRSCVAAEFASGGAPYPTFQKFLKVADAEFGCIE